MPAGVSGEAGFSDAFPIASEKAKNTLEETMVRFTNKMSENYNVYNLNNNKGYLDKLNTQMSTKKKNNDPTDNPVESVRSLHFRGTLSEYNQYLEKNLSDAMSWTDTTQTAIDTAKELMRSLKAEFTSASNGTNENTDRWTYYENMVNVVKEFFNTGNTSNESRYVFTGARTGDSLTFSEKNFDDRVKATGGIYPDKHKDSFKYRAITEHFDQEDLVSYTYTARTDKTGTAGYSGVTESEITTLDNVAGEETHVSNVEVFRLRLSYKKLDETQENEVFQYTYTKPDGSVVTETRATDVGVLYINDGTTTTSYAVQTIKNDYEVNQDSFPEGGNRIYLNTTTGNLIFGKDISTEVANAIEKKGDVYFRYNKSEFEEGDAKPEHFFDCVDLGAPKSIVYDDREYKKQNPNSHEQDIIYNIGEGQDMKINTAAEDVFSLDARRDLDELYDALTAKDKAENKLKTLKEMQEDTARYGSDADQAKISDLIYAVEKELQYISSKVDKMFSNGITRSESYYNKINLAGSDMGSVVNRLRLVQNRLTEHQTTTTAQASDNENIDIASMAVEVNSATMSFSAALQVTGKISQQSLVNFL